MCNYNALMEINKKGTRCREWLGMEFIIIHSALKAALHVPSLEASWSTPFLADQRTDIQPGGKGRAVPAANTQNPCCA